MAEFLIFETALGWMGVVLRAGRLARVILPESSRGSVRRRIDDAFPGTTSAGNNFLYRAARQLAEDAAGARRTFNLPLDLGGMSAFRRRVLRACGGIPFGQCWTYGGLAAAVGSPRAARAVGQVMRLNPLPIVIPCHRVLGADGRLVGFGGPSGVRVKRRLLAHEGVAFRGGNVLLS